MADTGGQQTAQRVGQQVDQVERAHHLAQVVGGNRLDTLGPVEYVEQGTAGHRQEKTDGIQHHAAGRAHADETQAEHSETQCTEAVDRHPRQQPQHQNEIEQAQCTGPGVHQAEDPVGGAEHTTDDKGVGAQNAGESQVDGEVEQRQGQDRRIVQ